MKFDISASGRLAGAVNLPGDFRLTLSAMAFGMAAGEPVTIVNPSPAPEVQGFRAFLESAGARFTLAPGGFTLHGKPYEGETILSPNIPDEIFHSVLTSALGTSRSLRIVNGVRERASMLKPLLRLLPSVGFREIAVSEDGNDVVLRGSGFSPSPVISVSSAWEFEAAAAAAFSVGKPVSLRYPAMVVSHDLRLLKALGSAIVEPESRGREENELARRLARASGEKPLEESCFTWECRPCTIKIPGDVTLGAALAGAAATTQRSEVILTQILWEPGRRGFFEALRRMKGDIEAVQSPKSKAQNSKPEIGYSFETADVRIRGSRLEGIRVTPAQARNITAELTILGAVAVSAEGETVIHEPEAEPFTGRNEDFKFLAAGLLALGAHLGDFSGGIVVKGPSHELKGDLTDSGGKPGVALALAVAGMSASGTTSVFGFDEGTYPVNEFLEKIQEMKESDKVKN